VTDTASPISFIGLMPGFRRMWRAGLERIAPRLRDGGWSLNRWINYQIDFLAATPQVRLRLGFIPSV
jgi:hypothetical protein